MTATPSRIVDSRFRISDEDRADECFRLRLYAQKLTSLSEPVTGKKDAFEKLAEELARQAKALADEVGATRVAVMVNRVGTARRVFERLQKNGLEARLVIGRMRPYDRERLNTECSFLKSGTPRQARCPMRVYRFDTVPERSAQITYSRCARF